MQDLIALALLLAPVALAQNVCSAGVIGDLARFAQFNAIQIDCSRTYPQYGPTATSTRTVTSGTNTSTSTRTTTGTTVTSSANPVTVTGSTVTSTAAASTTTKTVAAATPSTTTITVTTTGTATTVLAPSVVTEQFSSVFTLVTGATSTITATPPTTTTGPATTITTTSTTTSTTTRTETSTTDVTVTAPPPDSKRDLPNGKMLKLRRSPGTAETLAAGPSASIIREGNSAKIIKYLAAAPANPPTKRSSRIDRRAPSKEEDFYTTLKAQGSSSSAVFRTYCSCYLTKTGFTSSTTLTVQASTTTTITTTTNPVTTVTSTATTVPTAFTTPTVIATTTTTDTTSTTSTLTITPTVSSTSTTTTTSTTTIAPTITTTQTVVVTPTSTATSITTTIATETTTVTTTRTSTFTPGPTCTAGCYQRQYNVGCNSVLTAGGVIGSTSTATSWQDCANQCMNAAYDRDGNSWTGCFSFIFTKSTGYCELRKEQDTAAAIFSPDNRYVSGTTTFACLDGQ